MIVAAGLGTRLKPLTDTMPKALVPVGGKPLIEHVIHKLIEGGVTEIVINLHHFPEQIIRYVEQNNSFGICIRFSDETESLLETGGGIRKAEEWLGQEPFIVHNVDILSTIDIKALVGQHQRTQPLATLVVSERNTIRHFLFDDDNRLKGWTNQQTGQVKPEGLKHSELYHKRAFSGIQVISPKVFELMKKWPERFSITDFYLENLQSNTILGYSQENYRMMDVGKLNALKEAEDWLLTTNH